MKREEAKQLATDALNELQEALQQGKSDTLLRYLDTMSRFHSYSWGNSLMIAVQFPEATFVAGFRRWLQLGRYVRKGEKGIRILAPLAYRKKDDSGEPSDDGAKVLRGFKVVSVFDISQTDGEDLPAFASIQGEPGELLLRMEELVRGSGIKLIYEDMPHGTKGVSRKGEIGIANRLTPPEQVAVLAHELAHETMHSREERQGKSKTVLETEAEAVSYVVCRAFGLDCSTRSADYIQLYQGDAATLAGSLERIQRTAARIIESLQSSDATAEEPALAQASA